MPQPPEVQAIADKLTAAYRRAQARIIAEQQQLADNPAYAARQKRLSEMVEAIDSEMEEIEAEAMAWAAGDLPQAYAAGAAGGAAGAGGQIDAWTQIHTQAVQQLVQTGMNDLLQATSHVRTTTKQLVRAVANDEALQKAIEGKTAEQAGRLMRARLEESGIYAVRYADGSRHGLAEYSQMAMRTTTAKAYNLGTLNGAAGVGVVWWECFDGPECGWVEHNDPELALGKIVNYDDSVTYLISHPACRRTFGPRPDLQTPEDAAAAAPTVTRSQVQDQLSADLGNERPSARAQRMPRRTDQRTALEKFPKAQAPSDNPRIRARQAKLEARQGRVGQFIEGPPPDGDIVLPPGELVAGVKSVEQLINEGWDPAKAVEQHKTLKTNEGYKEKRLRAKARKAAQADPTAVFVDEFNVFGHGAGAHLNAEQVLGGPQAVAKASVTAEKATTGQSVVNAARNVTAVPERISNAQAEFERYLPDAKTITGYIPADGVQVHGGYVVGVGVVTKRDGIAYLFELRDGAVFGDTERALFEKKIKAVQDALKGIPADKRALQKRVVFAAHANPEDAYWAKAYNKPGFKSAATGGQGGTNFWDSATTWGTVRHELGHTIDLDEGGGKFFSESGAVVKGTERSWAQAADLDKESSSVFSSASEYSEGAHPMTPGTGGVSDYGQLALKEDFAESIRLWTKDAADGKLAQGPDGIALRFRDIFPERAKILDRIMGVDPPTELTQWQAHAVEEMTKKFVSQPIQSFATLRKEWGVNDSIVQKAADDAAQLRSTLKAETLKAAVKEELAARDILTEAKGLGIAVPDPLPGLPKEAYAVAQQAAKGSAQPHNAADLIDYFKLHVDQLPKGFTLGDIQAHADDAFKVFVHQLDVGGVREKVEAARKLKGLTKADLPKADRDYIRRKKSAIKTDAIRAGVDPAEAQRLADAFEESETNARLLRMVQGGGTSPGKFPGGKFRPGVNEGIRKRADDHLLEAGKAVHPLSKTQYGVPEQAKANIAAELGGRLNNEAGWNAYKTMREAQGDIVKPFEETTKDYRQSILDREASDRIQQWASTSGDSNFGALAMQMAARDEFGSTAEVFVRGVDQSTIDRTERLYKTAGPFMRLFLRHMYEHTQEEFAKAGIKEVSVYRGMFSHGQEIPSWAKAGAPRRIALQPLNSWSTRIGTSQGFGRHIFEVTVPVERVIGSARTGFGCLHEYEYVILDSEGEAHLSLIGATEYPLSKFGVKNP